MDQALPWIGFNILILSLLALDLGVLQVRIRLTSLRGALAWSAFWISLAMLFNLGLLFWRGREAAVEFLTGYLIEKSLSVDNLFVFLMIFTSFSVPPLDQRKALFWGIVGALIMRGALIWVGVTLLSLFEWAVTVLGAFLVLTGIRFAFVRKAPSRLDRNLVLRLFRRFVPMTQEYHEGRFVVRKDGRRLATPLLLVVAVIEGTDLLFALDSLPAIFAVTSDPFIVYTSNVFAILGMRALYFGLYGLFGLFHYLTYGLAAILVFVGVKMLVAETHPIPVGLALGVVGGILAASIVVSLASKTTGPKDRKP
ncbi:MAG: TerC family protein [Planctomycetes bacterium]|nr:TerC family protein [Planctomycetota bacterium]